MKTADIFSRTKVLLGEKFDILQKSHVLVVGVGGVGGHTAEFLVRSGIGAITIADFDVVDVTNINRQIVALCSTVGKPKTAVLKQRLLDINPSLQVTEKFVRFDETTKHVVFDGTQFDFVVDAIDSVDDKVCLIETTKKLGFKIVSSMGAGNRSGLPSFLIKDIFETQNDGLARVMRKKLRERAVSDVPCVCASSSAQKHTGSVVGSISYFPSAAATVISAFVVNSILGAL